MDYKQVFTMKRLWLMFTAMMVVMFSVLLAIGGRLYQEAPPVPNSVLVGEEVLFTAQNINDGRDVWRQLGGMQLGSVWGHGGYLAPDWTADFLHREAVEILSARAGSDFEQLESVERARLVAVLKEEIHENTFDSATEELRISAERAAAIKRVVLHYQGLFSGDSVEMEALREKYAIPNSPAGNKLTAESIRDLSAFFWWTAWAAVTHRPDDSVSYTNNWPHEPLVGNTPTASAFLWTIVSVVLLILAIGLLCWFFNRERDSWNIDKEPEDGYPADNPLDAVHPTASMRGVKKYVWLVIVMIGAQIMLGATTAHYAVEGHDFYGFPLSDYFPYALTRTWHTQLAVLWIAVSWLGAGLYAAPLIGGFEPPRQHWGVNLLFVALLVAVSGAMVGQYVAIHGAFLDSPKLNFWFGHQGYEYIDMGRFWQILIFVGLLVWFFLMMRGILPAIRRRDSNYHLLLLLAFSSGAIGLLYGAGLLYDKDTHLTIAEYWRWWVVHLWVEGVFEVFAAAWISWVFVRMRLLHPYTAAIYVMFSAMIFLGGGILGTFHHLYFQGTPESVLALGAVFSALEVVPLALIAFEAHDHWVVEKNAPWVRSYHMPLMFFFAVAFWNLIGAGVLGFLINPPLALYYLQGLQTTPAHGHAALFGVYGLLGIGLLLFCLRGLTPKTADWSDSMLRKVFWLFNGGLSLMVFASILPQGLLQAHESFSKGYWHARTAEFMHSELMETLVWIRVPGDIVFSLGALLLLIFAVKTLLPRRE